MHLAHSMPFRGVALSSGSLAALTRVVTVWQLAQTPVAGGSRVIVCGAETNARTSAAPPG